MNINSYEKNVFINCPFDDKYKAIFYGVIFTTIYCGYTPRSALEEIDSSNSRFQKILNIIAECKYSIHDISRTELNENNLPRFNMPLELGLCLGAKYLGTKKQKEKNALIMDCEKFRYQQYISDIAGQDIKAHNNDVEKAIKSTREWIKSFNSNPIAGPNVIILKYKDFKKQLPQLLDNLGLSDDEITYSDFLMLISIWLKVEI